MPKRTQRAFLMFAVLSLSLTVTKIASAALITHDYSGAISSMRYADCVSYSNMGSCSSWDSESLNSSKAYKDILFSIGDLFSGSYTYDTTTKMSLSDDGYQGTYLNALTNYDFKMNSFSEPEAGFLNESSSVSVVDGRFGSDLFAAQKNYLFEDWFMSFNSTLIDNSGSVFDGLDLPESLRLGDFSSYQKLTLVFLRRSDGDQLRIEGLITDLSSPGVYDVPEPGSLSLLAIGILGLSVINYRRQKSAC